ncbi:molybdenum cofactor sulfurase [Kiloniella spongiae]|uniref:Molybdenum cofactor sulfurase n=1 Tax=Kiloniella spongiae TaxID=1489064 RepID=A0A0H2M9S9_9PROT|nr:MOSC domain-containing protein [Kiloniella spongiae]KLN59088.1 molybdenum cofactor sulfurase [Kiloniella spongiae]
MTNQNYILEHILTGKSVPFGPKGQPSAIAKKPVSGSLKVTKLGVAGDEQADPRHHGGPEKALHHYPRDHYSVWTNEFPEIDTVSLNVGGFGENISTTGLQEKDICIGDVFRFGSATVQVAQGRQPCWKLNVRFGFPKMAAAVQKSGRTGWYYRVLEEGFVKQGDELTLIDQPNPDWSLARIQNVLYVDTLNQENLQALVSLKELASNWQDLAQKRLSRLEVEDWNPRLQTPV